MGQTALRRALLGMPSLAVVVVGLGMALGAARPIRAARIYGGPTAGGDPASWRIEAIGGLPGELRPAPGVALDVVALGGGRAMGRTTDRDGSAEVLLAIGGARPRPSVRVRDHATQAVLAEGSVQATGALWRDDARRRGGWLEGSREGALRLQVAPGRGAFAVPFSDPLLVRVEDAEGPVARAAVTARCDGASAPAGGVLSDDRGVARVRLTPSAHAPSCTVLAHRDAEGGRMHVALPVVPGALHARREGDVLVVEAPGTREAAYVALVTEQARLGAHRVALSPSRAGSSGRLELSPGERRATHAVVSSEADFRSPSLIGWPITDSEGGEPQHTFDARDQLLLDGVTPALAAEDARRRGVRTATLAALGVVGVSAMAGFMLSARAARGEGSSRWAWVAVAMMALAFVAYAVAVVGRLS